MIDKVQKIREEVARIQLYTQSEVLKQVLDYIDEVQEEPVSEDIEEAAKKYALNNTPYEDCTDEMSDAFKAGAKWQKEKDEEEKVLTYKHGFEDCKEHMMTKSIEAVVSQVPCSNEIILYNPSSVDKYNLPQEMNKLGLNKGDKVKLVIIKED